MSGLVTGLRPSSTSGDDVLRVGNCSGFYGDRLSAMREMLEGGELDVVTGDYLAELTMLILGKDQLKDPSLGYARTFVRQLEDCLGLALERGVRIVANAGGLNPAGLAGRLREVARGLGLDAAIAHVEGDDVRDLGLVEGALTANAYDDATAHRQRHYSRSRRGGEQVLGQPLPACQQRADRDARRSGSPAVLAKARA